MEITIVKLSDILGHNPVKTYGLIDFEFTGLDNSFITDNEIIQVKIKNIDNGKCVIKNFNSHKLISAYSLMLHRKIFLWDTFIRHYSYWHELQQPLSHCIKRLRFLLQRKALIYKL